MITEEVGLEDCPELLQPQAPKVEFEEAEPSWKEVEETLKKARAASAPGPNGIPYAVYKNCKTIMEAPEIGLEKRENGRELDDIRGLLHPKRRELKLTEAVPDHLAAER